MSDEQFQKAAEVFVELAKSKARDIGVLIARAKEAPLHFQQNKSPAALTGLRDAAIEFATAFPTMKPRGMSVYFHASRAVQECDVTRWWVWSHPNEAPQLEGDDEFIPLAEVMNPLDDHEQEEMEALADFDGSGHDVAAAQALLDRLGGGLDRQ